MEIQDPFTLTFSNESSIFSNNTLYSFRTNINPPINLPFHKWEVALTRMTLPQTRYIFMPSSEFEILLYHYYEDIDENDPISIRISVQSKFYNSIEELVKWLGQSILMAVTRIYTRKPYLYNIREGRLPGAEFEISIEQNRVYLSELFLTGIHPDQKQISMFKVIKGRELWNLLGFHNLRTNRYFDLPFNAKYPPRLAEENSALLLSAPQLVVEQYLGNNKHPLLELIPYNQDSKTQYNLFEQRYPLYKTILGGYINNIQIELLDIDNKPLLFESGKLQIELHFRPCRNSISR